MTEIALVAMRLVDMHRVHSLQDDGRVCSKCGARVGIYPSGQKALARRPDMAIICVVCASPGPGDEAVPAGPVPEILQEIRDSKEVGRA